MKDYVVTLARDLRHANWRLWAFAGLFVALLAFFGLTQVPAYPGSAVAPGLAAFVSQTLPLIPLSLREIVLPLMVVGLVWLGVTDGQRAYRLSRGEVYTTTTLLVLWLVLSVTHAITHEPVIAWHQGPHGSFSYTISLYFVLTLTFVVRLLILPLERRLMKHRREIKGMPSAEIFK